MTRKTRFLAVTIVAAFSATGLIARAGDLSPPVGPVAPTQRTPVNANMTPGDADSLFKISQRGSYYLTGNILGFAGKHGIEIAASGVTLDLNGFDMVGVAKMGVVDGVTVTVSGLTNIAVINGSVRNWGDEGVDLGTVTAANCRVADLLASGNADYGIRTGNGSTVTNCAAYLNTGGGIIAGTGSTVTSCSATDNTGHGINISVGCTVLYCSAFSNTGTGITVTNCSANFNTSNGIFASSGSTVADCTARSNTLDGILCLNACVIRGNTCNSSGSGGDGAGIHAASVDNRIEGNNCTGADRGIDVDTAGNIIVRNTCANNSTNWVIAPNNVCGPILDRTAPASAAISGNFAPDSTGSTHPNANFTY